MSKWTPEMEAELQYWAENSSSQVGIEGETLTAALAEIRRLRTLVGEDVERVHRGRMDRVDGARAMQTKCADIAASYGEYGYQAALDIEDLNPEDV